MSNITVIYWRDIPAQVVSGQGRRAERTLLPDRFQEAIDRAATRAGLIGSDEYMAEWRKIPLADADDAGAVAERLTTEMDEEILDSLIRNYGRAH
ncbi:virulence factor [soil metagenome]